MFQVCIVCSYAWDKTIQSGKKILRIRQLQWNNIFTKYQPSFFCISIFYLLPMDPTAYWMKPLWTDIQTTLSFYQFSNRPINTSKCLLLRSSWTVAGRAAVYLHSMILSSEFCALSGSHISPLEISLPPVFNFSEILTKICCARLRIWVRSCLL